MYSVPFDLGPLTWLVYMNVETDENVKVVMTSVLQRCSPQMAIAHDIERKLSGLVGGSPDYYGWCFGGPRIIALSKHAPQNVLVHEFGHALAHELGLCVGGAEGECCAGFLAHALIAFRRLMAGVEGLEYRERTKICPPLDDLR